MRIVINTKTQAEEKALMVIFEKIKGWKWCDGTKPTERNNWNRHKEETCVRYEDEFCCADIDFYKNMSWKIISFEEFIEIEFGDKKICPHCHEVIE